MLTLSYDLCVHINTDSLETDEPSVIIQLFLVGGQTTPGCFCSSCVFIHCILTGAHTAQGQTDCGLTTLFTFQSASVNIAWGRKAMNKDLL